MAFGRRTGEVGLVYLVAAGSRISATRHMMPAELGAGAGCHPMHCFFPLRKLRHVQRHNSKRGGCLKLSIRVSSFDHACEAQQVIYCQQR